MKTLKKNCQGLYLQNSKKRWKWMAGATAATAAGVTASQASTITINLISDYISFAGGNHLNADLTGDGHPDLTMANASFGVRHGNTSAAAYVSYARVNLNGVPAPASLDVYNFWGAVRLGSQSVARSFFSTNPPPSLMGSIGQPESRSHLTFAIGTESGLQSAHHLGGHGNPRMAAFLIDRNCGRRKRWVGKAAHRNGDVLLSALLNVEHCRAAR